ncbi:MAG: FIST N-terminal domain-containing protein [Steroidobacteraceae bacterium]
MKWASIVDTSASLSTAVEQAGDQLFAALGKQEPNLVLAFVSEHHAALYDELPALVAREFDSAHLVGCSGTGVIGAAGEIEDRPALVLMGALLPGVRIRATHLDSSDIPPVYAEPMVWEETVRLSAAQEPSFLVLSDPHSFEVESFLKGLDRIFPRATKVGGIASGGSAQAGSHVLFLDQHVYRSGAVVIGFTGDIEIDTVVAQGCRPVGDPMFVTLTHENLIRELDGHAARDVLANVYERLPYNDRDLFSRSLFLGLALRQDASEYGPGDFLIRTVLGLDPQSGALWVNSNVEQNRVVQFHLRDASASAMDLERMLTSYRSMRGNEPAAAALLFSCTGRGVGLYEQPDHDSNAFRRLVADIPIGGFFCNGEIGPVHNTTYLHSYTSVFAVFRPRL